MRISLTKNRAFTLIELLTVIAIIGVLVALLFPAIKSSMITAEKTKAATAISGLQTAFKAYYTEYGKWPVGDPAPNITYIVDAAFVALLQGVNVPVATFVTGPNAGFYGPPYNNTTSRLQGNPRGIRFLEFKQADLNGAGAFVDPWKTPYYCCFDVTYANTILDPFDNAKPPINGGFVIWSAGPDAQYDATGDLPPSPKNKDNVKSW
jgi:prepilin-type N-terminal cleavage/methylation domain-containing protein